MELDSGDIERWRQGPPGIDWSLEVQKLDEASALALEEAAERGIRVYCYPSFPASISHFAPLRWGVEGDPSDGTYTGGLTKATEHMYLLRSDPSHPVWFEEVLSTDPIIAREIRTGSGTSSRFPLGQGIFFPSDMENQVKNSLLTIASGYGPTDWSQTGGTWGTDCGVIPAAESFCGIPALYLWGQTVQIISDWFDAQGGEYIEISMAYRCDGALEVLVDYDVGFSMTFTTVLGSEWSTQSFIVPTGMTIKARITIKLTSGTYAEVAGIQAIQNGAVRWSKTPFFLGGESVLPLIAGAHADYKINAQTGIYPNDPVVICAGICQPAWGVDNVGPTQTLATLWTDRAADHSMQIDVADFGTGMKVHIRQDGTVEASSSTISPAHALGDSYAWMMYGGYTATGRTSFKIGAILRKIGETANCASCETGSGIVEYQIWDRLRLGASLSSATSFDGIISNAITGVISYAEKETLIAALANRDYLDLWREMVGRLYWLDVDLQQLPSQRRYYGGTISLSQARRIK